MTSVEAEREEIAALTDLEALNRKRSTRKGFLTRIRKMVDSWAAKEAIALNLKEISGGQLRLRST